VREQSRVLEHVGTIGGVDDTATLTGAPGDLPEQVEGQRFSAAVPLALGAKPLLGRWFNEVEADSWCRSTLDVGREMPKLATYLGHVDVCHTYWYIEAVPELLQLATERFGRSNAEGDR